MTTQELYQKIDLQPEIINCLEQKRKELDMQMLHLYLERMMKKETAAEAYQELRMLLDENNDRIKMLYCHLECARRLYERYMDKNIPEEVFIDTMKCFTRFIDECEKKNGRKFFDRAWWTYRQISMQIFRVGELEYEMKEYEGESVISLHIPSDADFSPKAVEKSLKQAQEFFAIYFPQYVYTKVICNSWLLSPELGSLLSKESNIRKFQDRFDILKENKEDREYIEWLFERLETTDYRELPEATSLQRKVKQLLLKDGNIGTAFGVMKIQ